RSWSRLAGNRGGRGGRESCHGGGCWIDFRQRRRCWARLGGCGENRRRWGGGGGRWRGDQGRGGQAHLRPEVAIGKQTSCQDNRQDPEHANRDQRPGEAHVRRWLGLSVVRVVHSAP